MWLSALASGKIELLFTEKDKTAEETNLLRKCEEKRRLITFMKKVKYLNRKKDELSGIFNNHKTQMDSFFTSITQTLRGE